MGVCTMTTPLTKLTNVQLKQYISEHRNDQDACSAALSVLISRSSPANRRPFSENLQDLERELNAFLQGKQDLTE